MEQDDDHKQDGEQPVESVVEPSIQEQAQLGEMMPSQSPPPAGGPQLPEVEKGSSLWQDAWVRLRKNRASVVSLFFLVLVGLICFVGPFLPGLPDPNLQALPKQNLWPNGEHWFGTDHLGRDLFSRVLYGGQISLTVGLVTAVVSLTIGVTWGAMAGFIGGWVDTLMMRVVDILYALPFLVIVILISANLSPVTERVNEWLLGLVRTMGQDSGQARNWIEPATNLIPLFIAIGALAWLNISRIVRASVQNVAKLEFVEAARSLGLSKTRILFRHVLPNVLGPIIVYTTLTIPSVMLLEATLSFLGLGTKAPNASWGVLISEGADRMFANPQLLLFPSILFVLTLLSLNFLGDGLRDALDPRSAKD